MIAGTFGDNGELLFEIELIAASGLELLVDVWLDTGFSGWLAMNSQDLEGLDWVYANQQMMLTAQGNVDFQIYIGKVRINQEEFDIPVHVGTGVPEFLIGCQWLKNMRLLADMPLGILTLG